MFILQYTMYLTQLCLFILYCHLTLPLQVCSAQRATILKNDQIHFYIVTLPSLNKFVDCIAQWALISKQD